MKEPDLVLLACDGLETGEQAFSVQAFGDTSYANHNRGYDGLLMFTDNLMGFK